MRFKSRKRRERSIRDLATELLWTVQRLPNMGSCSDGSPRRYVLPEEARDLLIELLEGIAKDPDARPAHRPADLVERVMRYLQDDAELEQELLKHRTRGHALKAVATREGIDWRSFEKRLQRGQKYERKLRQEWEVERQRIREAKPR